MVIIEVVVVAVVVVVYRPWCFEEYSRFLWPFSKLPDLPVEQLFPQQVLSTHRSCLDHLILFTYARI